MLNKRNGFYIKTWRYFEINMVVELLLLVENILYVAQKVADWIVIIIIIQATIHLVRGK